MSKGHNKKRNVGLVYEQIVRQASVAATEKRVDDAKEYVDLAKKYFSKNSELAKEFKLFNAILETSGVSERVATRVLELARESAAMIDIERLGHEKGSLINEANRVFGRGELFNTRVENFRALATVQSLLNEWRNPGTLSPAVVAKYERQLVNFMMMSPQPKQAGASHDVDPLAVKMFHKRFDEHYQDKLTPSQKKFLNDVTFLNSDQVHEIISETKSRVLDMLDDRNSQETNNLLREQYERVRSNIAMLDPTSAHAPASQLTLLQLIDELEDEDE